MPAGKRPVAIIMGSKSDWKTMRHAAKTLKALKVGFDARVVSAHRTPDRLYKFAKGARGEGFKVVIAGAGGAAHLPGMTASLTSLPVFGVPVKSKALKGVDSFLSIAQMPAGIPVGHARGGRSGCRKRRAPGGGRAGHRGQVARETSGRVARSPDPRRRPPTILMQPR